MRNHLYIVFFILVCLIPVSAYAPLAIKDAPVKIDGRADEAFWAEVPVLSEFIQYEPKEKAEPSRRTEVKIAYSADALYVFARMEEEPEKIVRVLTRRDRNNQADNFSLEIDSYNDRRSGYHFRINAAGSLRDGTMGNDNFGTDYSWDAVWEAKAGTYDKGWTAEMRIPFTCLRFTGSSVDKMHFNCRRFIAWNRESVSLIDQSSDRPGYVSRFPKMEITEKINTGQPVAAIPYVSLNKISDTDLGYYGGMDIATGWSNVMLNATVNPDFGQVEADQALIDLSGFETFFPEKRAFFLEGSRVFSTPYRLFYSRRIGRKPTGSPVIPDGGVQVEKPVNTTILGAAKLTGKTPGGFQFGIIEALTARELAMVADSLGNESEQEVEPLALYQVARFKQDVFKRSSVGVMSSSRNYRDRTGAAAFGTDWNLGTPHPDYIVTGQVVGSRTPEEGWGFGGQGEISKDAGDHVTGHIGGHYDQEELNLNPAGFFTGHGRQGMSANVNTFLVTEKYGLRKVSLNTVMKRTWNLDGTPLENRFELNHNLQHDLVSMNLGYNRDFRTYNDHFSDHGSLIGKLATQEIWSWITPQLGTDIDLTLKLEYRPVWEGQNWKRIGGSFAVRPVDRWELSFDTRYAVVNDPLAFLTSTEDDSGSGVDLVGVMDQETFDLTTRSTFLFTNTLSLQFYNQVLTGVTDYSDFKKMVSPFTVAGMDGITYTDDPDFRRTVCNTSLIMRWEYLPGSAFYLVYAQSFDRRTGTGSGGLWDGFETITSDNTSHSILMKIDYRFSVNLN